LKDRLGGDVQSIGNLLDLDFHVGQQAGAQQHLDLESSSGGSGSLALLRSSSVYWETL